MTKPSDLRPEGPPRVAQPVARTPKAHGTRLCGRAATWLVLAGALATPPTFARPWVFISNQGSDSVSLVDIATQRVEQTITVGKAPAGVAVSAAAGKAFITNPGEHTVSVIDLATRRVLATLPAGQGSVGVAVSPDGRYFYVADWFGQTLRQFDARTHQALATQRIGVAPAGVSVAPDSKTVYVANRDDNEVMALDATTLAITARLPVGEHPFAIELTPDGRTLLALNVLGDSVDLIDVASRQRVARITVGHAPYGVAFGDDGRGQTLAYVTNQRGNSVSVIGLQQQRVLATWGEAVVGEYPEGIAVIGAQVLVVSWMDDAAYLVDRATGTRIATIELGRNPRGFGQLVQP